MLSTTAVHRPHETPALGLLSALAEAEVYNLKKCGLLILLWGGRLPQRAGGEGSKKSSNLNVCF